MGRLASVGSGVFGEVGRGGVRGHVAGFAGVGGGGAPPPFTQISQQDAALRARLNGWLKTGLLTFVEQHRPQAARLIQETVAKWDAEDLCRNLEAEVGRDLQFIRINGTLVGGLVGLTLHLLTRLLWH